MTVKFHMRVCQLTLGGRRSGGRGGRNGNLLWSVTLNSMQHLASKQLFAIFIPLISRIYGRSTSERQKWKRINYVPRAFVFSTARSSLQFCSYKIRDICWSHINHSSLAPSNEPLNKHDKCRMKNKPNVVSILRISRLRHADEARTSAYPNRRVERERKKIW